MIDQSSVTMIDSIFKATTVSFSFAFHTEKPIHLSIFELSFKDDWRVKVDQDSFSVHDMVLMKFSIVDGSVIEVEKTLRDKSIFMLRTEIDTISVFLYLRVWDRIDYNFEQSNKEKKNLLSF